MPVNFSLSENAIKNMLDYMYVMGRRDDYLRGIIRSVTGTELKRETSADELARRRKMVEEAEVGKPVSKILPEPKMIQEQEVQSQIKPIEQPAMASPDQASTQQVGVAQPQGFEEMQKTSVFPVQQPSSAGKTVGFENLKNKTEEQKVKTEA